jgi:hypothetical protein
MACAALTPDLFSHGGRLICVTPVLLEVARAPGCVLGTTCLVSVA